MTQRATEGSSFSNGCLMLAGAILALPGFVIFCWGQTTVGGGAKVFDKAVNWEVTAWGVGILSLSFLFFYGALRGQRANRDARNEELRKEQEVLREKIKEEIMEELRSGDVRR